MKKKAATYIALLLLPLMAVGVAISPTSVTVVRGGEVSYASFAMAVEGSAVGWCAPIALLLTYALFALAVIYGLTKKQLWLQAIRAVAFVATFLAALPILVKGDVMIVPNVLVAIILAALWAAAYFTLKSKDKPEEAQTKGHRLTRK